LPIAQRRNARYTRSGHGKGIAIANLRPSYGATVLAHLDWSDHELERAIDRVAAAGKVSPLGLLIWKAAYCHESTARTELERALMKRYRSRYLDGPILGKKFVEQAVIEYLSPECLLCQGKKEVLHDNRLVSCPTCSGSGLKRYSDAERATRMELSWSMTKHSAHKIGWILNLIRTEDSRVNYQMNVELERFDLKQK
jgi:hypothetical protein